MASDAPPLSQTFLSAIPGNSETVKLYYQAIDGCVYEIEYSARDDKDLLPSPSPGVRGRALALYTPAAVISYNSEPFIYYFDENHVLIEAAFYDIIIQQKAQDSSKPPRPQIVEDLNWVDIKAASFSKLASMALKGQGVWVYYQSGRETGIREIWKHSQLRETALATTSGRHSEQLTFHVFSLELPKSVISGSALAAAIKGPSGGFIYQSADYRIHYHKWEQTAWKDYDILPPSAPAPAPNTSLAIGVDSSNNTFVYYLTLHNYIARLLNHTGTPPTEWYYEPIEGIALPGSSLATARYRIGVAVFWMQMGSQGPEIAMKYDYVPRV